MGLVTYVNRADGSEVQTEFPLHSSLISYTAADGAVGQLFRNDFEREFVQKLPTIPAATLPPEPAPAAAPAAPAAPSAPAAPPYEPPALSPASTALSHQAWFAAIYQKLRAMEEKIVSIFEAHPALKDAIDRVETKVIQLAEKKTGIEPPPG